MDNGSTLLNASVDAHWLAPSGPRILVEAEPAHRVFLANLADILLRRRAPELDLASKPGVFWADVFIPRRMPWGSLLESALWHASAILVVVAVSQSWKPDLRLDGPWKRTSSIVYYRPDPTFPAARSNPPRVLPAGKQQFASLRPLQVPREVTPRHEGLIAPPDIAALTKPKVPTISSPGPVTPAMPMAAAPGSQRKTAQFGVSVVEPPPDVKQAAVSRSGGLQVVVVAPAPSVGNGMRGTGSRAGGLQAAVVAPAPGVGTVSGRRGLAGLDVKAVAPAPTLPSGSPGRIGGGDGGNLLHVVVVGPAPKLPVNAPGSANGSGASGFGGTGAAVVPPPPSLSGSGIRRAGGTSGSGASGLAGSEGVGSGMAAIPPPPAIESAGGPGGGGGAALGRSGRGGNANIEVVPPAPSLAGSGGSRGRGGLGGTGTGVVPPAPSVEGSGTLNGRGGGLGGDSLAAVPPAPSLDGTGNGAGGPGGRGNGASLGGDAAVGPSPSMDGVSDPKGGQGLDAGVEELPMRIVGLAFALPGTSFSSSYEVFIAEKELAGHKVQLIKLVYWFLPYQQRLSEYHPDASKLYKLRVTRDHACDESLAHMTVSPTGQLYSGSHLPDDALQMSEDNRNANLPCYRTTADDYLKAMSRKRSR